MCESGEVRRPLALFVSALCTPPVLASCTSKQPRHEAPADKTTVGEPADAPLESEPTATTPSGPVADGEPFDVPAWPEPPELEQKESCPLVIEPGVRLGGVAIGMTRKQLTQAGLPIKAEENAGVVFAGVDQQKVMLCDGKVTSTWIEDIRIGPDCLEFEGSKLERDIPQPELATRLGGCAEQMMIGGTTADCKGGVAISYGMGEWLSIRVLRNGDSIQDDCAMILDDGQLLNIDDERLAKFVEDVANLSELSGFWHVTEPDRKPLRLLLPADLRSRELEPFRQFGMDAAYLDGPTELPHIEFTSIRFSETRAEVKFRYAVEGVVGTLSYRKRYDTWTQESVEVAEQ